MNKKKVIAFIPADKNNQEMAQQLINSIRKFHSAKELPIVVLDNPNPSDKEFWYRAKPVLAMNYIKDYELVIGLDADQICFGSLSEILNSEYDVATVLNINRVDPSKYGIVQFQGVAPSEYVNNGLVALRSEDFINRWYTLCFSKYFSRLQYREQDILNVLVHYGGYNVRCLDHYSGGYKAWHGLVAKGETANAYLKDGEVIIPKGETGYPDSDIVLKMWHTAGGAEEKKRNYRIYFNDSVQKYIEWLISDSKEPYKEVGS